MVIESAILAITNNATTATAATVNPDLYTWFFTNAGPIITILFAITGATKYLEGRTNHKIDMCKQEMVEKIKEMTEGICKDLSNLKDSSNITKNYLEKDVEMLKRAIFRSQQRSGDYDNDR